MFIDANDQVEISLTVSTDTSDQQLASLFDDYVDASEHSFPDAKVNMHASGDERADSKKVVVDKLGKVLEAIGDIQPVGELFSEVCYQSHTSHIVQRSSCFASRYVSQQQPPRQQSSCS